MTAPESDAENHDEPETWTNAQLEQFEDALKRKKLQAFLVEDSIMKIMRLKTVGTLQGHDALSHYSASFLPLDQASPSDIKKKKVSHSYFGVQNGGMYMFRQNRMRLKLDCQLWIF
ncbi:unnamed protein product [Phytophthora fragariaefolia]|uniref:Unnamed protein product n=1 Tax=Phytophthora fragariaefolia TaxID=1490495 RepID=A0A9W6XCC9_9STRA|nr:unnamed protein product [Phytophthora fragariaefolia]